MKLRKQTIHVESSLHSRIKELVGKLGMKIEAWTDQALNDALNRQRKIDRMGVRK
jgi:hypothetical protein